MFGHSMKNEPDKGVVDYVIGAEMVIVEVVPTEGTIEAIVKEGP